MSNKLAHSQSNTNLIMLCPYMNRFAHSSFSNSNRTFSSVSGLSNPSLYGRTRSLIIKPLLSNAATISFCSRCDSITDNNSSNNQATNNNTTTTITSTIHNDVPHHEIGSSFNQQSSTHNHHHHHHDDESLNRDHEDEFESAKRGGNEERPVSVAAQHFSQPAPHSSELLADSTPSMKPLSRRLSQHLIYPLVQPVVQSPSQIHMHQQHHHHQQQQPEVKKINNPVIALIAHDLLKFMEEENHYRLARESLKSDVEKIRKSRKSSVSRGTSSTRNSSNYAGTYSTATNNTATTLANTNTNAMTMQAKPRARSSVSAFRNVYARTPSSKNLNGAAYTGNSNYSNQSGYLNDTFYNSKPAVNNYHSGKMSHSRPAPPPAQAVNTNELIDKLLLQVYGN